MGSIGGFSGVEPATFRAASRSAPNTFRTLMPLVLPNVPLSTESAPGGRGIPGSPDTDASDPGLRSGDPVPDRDARTVGNISDLKIEVPKLLHRLAQRNSDHVFRHE